MVTQGNWRPGLLRVLRLTKVVLVGVATAIVMSVGISQWQEWQFQLRERSNLRRLEANSLGPSNLPSPESFYPVQTLARPPIVKDFEVLTVAEAQGQVRGSELVLALKIGDEARAYPLNMLNGPMREVINDELGGRSIAATW